MGELSPSLLSVGDLRAHTWFLVWDATLRRVHTIRPFIDYPFTPPWSGGVNGRVSGGAIVAKGPQFDPLKNFFLQGGCGEKKMWEGVSGDSAVTAVTAVPPVGCVHTIRPFTQLLIHTTMVGWGEWSTSGESRGGVRRKKNRGGHGTSQTAVTAVPPVGCVHTIHSHYYYSHHPVSSHCRVVAVIATAVTAESHLTPPIFFLHTPPGEKF